MRHGTPVRPLALAGVSGVQAGDHGIMWPQDADALVVTQDDLALAEPEPRVRRHGQTHVGGCWVCFPRGLTGPGDLGDPAWAAAVVMLGRSVAETHVVQGVAGAPYEPGLLALRTGPLMERAVRSLESTPDVLLLDATGHDHPRRAGLAIHLGAVLDLPTVGVTHRPLVAQGPWPSDSRGAVSTLRIGTEIVACWVRTRAGARPLVVHPGWRVDLTTAVGLVLATTGRHRTPEPLRRARQAARVARRDACPDNDRPG
jgi:deoxyribonuclease V